MCSNKTPELNLFQAFVDSSQDVLLLAQESALKLILLTSAVFRVIWPFQNQLLFCNSFSEFLFSSISPCAIFAYFRYMSRFFQPYFKVLRIISQFFSQILAQESAPQLFSSSSFSHISLLFQPYLKVLSTLFLGGAEYPKLLQSSMQTGQRALGTWLIMADAHPEGKKPHDAAAKHIPVSYNKKLYYVGACSRMEQTSNQGGHPKASKPVGLAIRAHGGLNLG